MRTFEIITTFPSTMFNHNCDLKSLAMLFCVAGCVCSEYEDAYCVVIQPKGARTISPGRFEIERMLPARDREELGVTIEVLGIKSDGESVPANIAVYNATFNNYAGHQVEADGSFHDNNTRAFISYNITIIATWSAKFAFRVLKPRGKHPLCYVTVFARKSDVVSRKAIYPRVNATLSYLPDLFRSQHSLYFGFHSDAQNFPTDVELSPALICGSSRVTLTPLNTGTNIFYANRTELEGYIECSYLVQIPSNSTLNFEKEISLPKSLPTSNPSVVSPVPISPQPLIAKADYDELVIVAIVLGIIVAVLFITTLVLGYKLRSRSYGTPKGGEATIRHIHDVNVNNGPTPPHHTDSDDLSFHEVSRTHIPPSPDFTTRFTDVDEAEVDGANSNMVRHSSHSSTSLEGPFPLDEHRA